MSDPDQYTKESAEQADMVEFQNNISELPSIERAKLNIDRLETGNTTSHPKDNQLSQPSEWMIFRKARREYYGNCAIVSLRPNNYIIGI